VNQAKVVLVAAIPLKMASPIDVSSTLFLLFMIKILLEISPFIFEGCETSMLMGHWPQSGQFAP